MYHILNFGYVAATYQTHCRTGSKQNQTSMAMTAEINGPAKIWQTEKNVD
jgi:hypothetical protein